MPKSVRRIFIGTGGWNYDHWSGLFYPPELDRRHRLAFYGRHFNTVELPPTFFRLDSGRWLAARLPDRSDFRFSVAIYLRRADLRTAPAMQQALVRCQRRLQGLADRLGAVLLRLPATLRRDDGLLRDLLSQARLLGPAVLDLPDASWQCDSVFAELDHAGVGFCVHDDPDRPAARVRTGPLAYLRFAGPGGRSERPYRRRELHEAACWLGSQQPTMDSAYVIFLNDVQGHALTNARQFQLLAALNRIPIVSIPPRYSAGHSVSTRR